MRVYFKIVAVVIALIALLRIGVPLLINERDTTALIIALACVIGTVPLTYYGFRWALRTPKPKAETTATTTEEK